jgi:hypothetical protein
MRFILVFCGCLLVAPAGVAQQRDSVLASRWVGIHLGRPLRFEFYGDTMLVLNDQTPLSFRLSRDSLIAGGDTVIQARWRHVLGHLLLDTPDGPITMSRQVPLARPLTGRWTGPLGTPDDRLIEVFLAANGTARWRDLSGGGWTTGEWERESRLIAFTWIDETEWQGQYDPIGNNLLLLRTVEGSQGSILRRAFR